MKKKLILLSGSVMGLLMPIMASAQGTTTTGGFFSASTCAQQGAVGTGGTIGNIICTIGNILNYIIPVIVILGIVYFVWGVISYVIAGDEEAKTKGSFTKNG